MAKTTVLRASVGIQGGPQQLYRSERNRYSEWTFYNEALGSVSQLSVYDRVRGRKGDVPDETVGAHSPEGGH